MSMKATVTAVAASPEPSLPGRGLTLCTGPYLWAGKHYRDERVDVGGVMGGVGPWGENGKVAVVSMKVYNNYRCARGRIHYNFSISCYSFLPFLLYLAIFVRFYSSPVQ